MKLPDAARAAVEKEIESHRKQITELEAFLKANGVNPMTDAQKAAHSAKIKAGMKKKKAAATATASEASGPGEANTGNSPASAGTGVSPTAASSTSASTGAKTAASVPSKPQAVTGKLPGKPAGVPLAPSAAQPEVVGATE